MEVDDFWIPGVELLPRTVFRQRHRGVFGELGREGEARLGKIGLWPRQWAAATMFAGTAKGFHLHPPFVPEGREAAGWFRELFVEEKGDFSRRQYDREQWDVMFFLRGAVEMFLVDERAGLERRVMRFFVEGDDRPGADNVAVVIPPGVAHALRGEGSGDVVMVYGTSIVFDAENEGRLGSGVEVCGLPEEWGDYLGLGSPRRR